VIKYLLTFDFNLNTDDFFSQTPLFYSAKNNSRCGVAAALLRSGCDVNHKDNNGQTCLFYAAGAGNLEMCRLFVDYGVNVQHVDRNRERAINYARKNGSSRLVDYPHITEYLNNCKM
jgi:ankyrin repeat protein